jgi:hypothetical protein
LRTIMAVLAMHSFLAEGAEPSKWESSGMTAQLRTIPDFENSGKLLYSTLIIEYSLQTKCSDAFISVLAMSSKKLGGRKSYDFKSSETENNKLNFLIDEVLFNYSPEKTMRVIYENGVEFGTIAPNSLVEKVLRSGKSIEVRIGNAKIFWTGKTTGINAALNSAKSICLSKL